MLQPIRAGGREVLRIARAATPTHQHLRYQLLLLGMERDPLQPPESP